MGQAKNKGTLQERKRQAMLRDRSLLPDTMKCNECGHVISEIIPLNPKAIENMNVTGIGFGICPNCDKVTFGIATNVESVSKIQEVFRHIDTEILYPILEKIRIDYLKTINRNDR